MSELLLRPDELREAAAHLRSLGNQWDDVNWRLRTVWERLDAGWESYASEGVDSAYMQASRELTQMGHLSYQYAWLLEAAAAWIEDADRQSAASFLALQADLGSLPATASKKP